MKVSNDPHVKQPSALPVFAATASNTDVYRLLFETSPDAVMIMDGNHFVECNEKTLQLFGCERTQLVGQPPWQFSPETQYDGTPSEAAANRHIEAALQGETQHFNWLHQRFDGTPFHAEVSLNAVSTNGATYLQAVVRDVSERWEMASSLEQSNERFRFLSENIQDVIWVLDAKTRRFLFMSKSIIRQRGYTPEEVMARPLDAAMDAHSAEIVRTRINHRLDDFERSEEINPETVYYTDRLRQPCRDGSFIWSEVVCSFHRNPITDRIEIHGITRNITKRVEAENKNRETSELLRTVINAIPSAVICTDNRTNIKWWNDWAEKLSGVTEHDAVNHSLADVWPGMKELQRLVRTAMRLNKHVRANKIRYSTKDEEKFLDIFVFPLDIDDRTGCVIRIDDVTDAANMQEILVRSEKMMSMGGLAAGMAHEINNPLGGILQSVQVIESRLFEDITTNEKAAASQDITMAQIRAYAQSRHVNELLTSIKEAGNRAAKIIRNMLTFARQDVGEFAPVNMNDLVETTISLAMNEFDLKRQVDFRHITIIREFAENLQPVRCDASRIQQVLLNLLKNAAQAFSATSYSPGSWKLVIRIFNAGHFCHVEVEDNGPGISKANMEQIFKPFFTTKEKGIGTGLGLSISTFIVRNIHKGDFQVRSTPGEGTCFSFTIPLSPNGN